MASVNLVARPINIVKAVHCKEPRLAPLPQASAEFAAKLEAYIDDQQVVGFTVLYAILNP